MCRFNFRYLRSGRLLIEIITQRAFLVCPSGSVINRPIYHLNTFDPLKGPLQDNRYPNHGECFLLQLLLPPYPLQLGLLTVWSSSSVVPDPHFINQHGESAEISSCVLLQQLIFYWPENLDSGGSCILTASPLIENTSEDSIWRRVYFPRNELNRFAIRFEESVGGSFPQHRPFLLRSH